MFVIVNVGTGRLSEASPYSGPKKYETERGAKGACTKMNRAWTGCELKIDENGQDVVQWKVMSLAEYNARPVKMVERVNLMSGKTFMEAEDTPNFCSPASETYWSM